MDCDAFLAKEKQQWQDQYRKLKYMIKDSLILSITQFDTKNKVVCKIATAITACH